jgi:hypothetical protein
MLGREFVLTVYTLQSVHCKLNLVNLKYGESNREV